jgi:tetratricopeptide (TPR) repeat protein
MKTLAKGILITFILTLTTIFVFGQKGVEDGTKYGHGQDSIDCIRNLSLYRSNIKHKDYGSITVNSWEQVYNNCPKASKYIYIDGIKMIEKKIKSTKNQTEKNVLIDSMMRIYDKRIANYNQKGYVLADKGVDFIKYSENTTENMQIAYDYLKGSVELEKYKSRAAQLLTFMQTSKSLFSVNAIEGGQVVEDYGKISEICDYIINNQKRGYKNIAKAKPSIDQIFETSGAATCDDLVPFYADKYTKTPEDIEFLKKSIHMLRATKCNEADIFFTMIEKLNTLEATAELAHELAKINSQAEKLEAATKYYKQALELEADNMQKAKYFIELGEVTRRIGNYPLSRTYALNCLKLDPNNGYAYLLIGNLYAATKDCGENEFEQKAVYWVSVDKFKKAKAVNPELTEDANRYIEAYEARFPRNENIFMYGHKLGETYTVGCWINEKTTVRASDK